MNRLKFCIVLPGGLMYSSETGIVDYYDEQGRHIVGGYGYEGYYYVPPFWKLDKPQEVAQ